MLPGEMMAISSSKIKYHNFEEISKMLLIANNITKITFLSFPLQYDVLSRWYDGCHILYQNGMQSRYVASIGSILSATRHFTQILRLQFYCQET